MERKSILKNLEEVFADVFDLEDVQLNEKTTAEDIEEWDSLSHVLMVVAVEKKFRIRFTSHEIISWENVGQMMDSIEKML